MSRVLRAFAAWKHCDPRPVYDLLGGLTREYVECYATSFPRQGDERETARACIEFGYRVYRMGVRGDRSWPYLLQGYDFRKGRMYPVARPGIGFEVDTKQLELILDVSERYAPMPTNTRPDGTPTNW